MTIASIAAVCVVLLALAFLAPRLSRHPQRGVDSTLGTAQRAGGQAPGVVGRLLTMQLGTSRRATNTSASLGRKGRSHLGV